MADFIAAGNNIGNVNKGRKWALLIALILIVLFVVKRNDITPVLDGLKEKLFPPVETEEMETTSQPAEQVKKSTVVNSSSNDKSTSANDSVDTSNDSDNKLVEENIAENIDVEGEVKAIREKYNAITDAIKNDTYKEVVIGKDITGYVADDVEAVYIKKGYDGNKYSRKYYFSDGKLIFAYFDAEDAHRLYFKDDKLFRWRYSENAKDAQNAINHDGDHADGYDDLEETAIKEAYSTAFSVQANN